MKQRTYKAGPYESLEAAVQAQELKLTTNGRIDFDDDFNVPTTTFESHPDEYGNMRRYVVTGKKKTIDKSEFQVICE